MRRKIRQTIEYHSAVVNLTTEQIQELLYLATLATTDNPQVGKALQRLRERRRIIPPLSYYRLVPEGRLVTTTGVLSLIVALLPPILSHVAVSTYDLLRPLSILVLALIAALAMPHRKKISVHVLRLANLFIFSAAVGLPLALPLAEQSPFLALLFFLIVAILVATIALTAGYLLAIPFRRSSPSQIS